LRRFVLHVTQISTDDSAHFWRWIDSFPFVSPIEESAIL
jgi:hypothetical protein